MTIKEILLEAKQSLKNADLNSLNLSLNHVHGKDIFSLVISGTEFGKLTRVFVCDRKLKPFDVQYHTHRYPLRITIIKGSIKHHTATIGGKDAILPTFDYKSPLNGGNGLTFLTDRNFTLKDNIAPVGSVIYLSETDFHTMSCSKGSMWIVEEMGFKTPSSLVAGMPFITEGLYKSPEIFQINDMCQRVADQIKYLLSLV